MTDHFLDKLVHSAREELASESPDVERTRAELLRRAHGRVRSRGRAVTVAAACLLVTAASSAFASSEQREQVIAFFERVLGSPAEERPTASKSRRGGPPLERKQAAPAATIDVPLTTPRQVPSVVPTPSAERPSPRIVSAHPPEPALSATEASVDPLFVEAHNAQFREKDPARALALWDRYLQRSPHSEFLPEASYNRAINLVRLGRTTEARAALRPFAEGRFGRYRQREARLLLTQMGDAGAGDRVRF